MNSPFVVEQARHVIQRLDASACRQPEQRISLLYRLLYGRAAEPDEVGLGLRFLQAAEEPKPRSGSSPAGKPLGAWEEYAQVLLLANEFVFVD
jgi:hypothetical protein